MIDYYAVINELYTGISDLDFSLESDGLSVKLAYWNESFGEKPTIDYLADNWLIVAKKIKKEEIKQRSIDEIEFGLSGYITQGLKTNLHISSSRSDLDNMKNLSSYCRQIVIKFNSGKYLPNINDTIFNADSSWFGTINSFYLLGEDSNGDSFGIAHFSSCKSNITVGDIGFILRDNVKVEVATIAEILKNSTATTMFRTIDNNFHQISIEELDIMCSELQAYGLWLYQHKWEKEMEIDLVTDLIQLDLITW